MDRNKNIRWVIARSVFICTLLVIGTSCEAKTTSSSPESSILPQERRISWNPGIPGGIPNYTVSINVKNAPYNAKGDGVSDDTGAIKLAIANCPANTAVYIPEGQYRLTSKILIQNKSIALRGDGPQKTRLLSEVTDDSAIVLSGTSTQIQANLVSGYTKGSTTISASSTSGFQVGDYVLISQTNDPSVCEGMPSYASSAIAQIVKITAISGNSMTINRPLYYTYDDRFSPQIADLNVIKNAGVEDLYVERVYDGKESASILLNVAALCWVKNVEGYNAIGFHVEIQAGYANEVRACYFHHGHAYTSGRAYGVWLFDRCTDNLIEDNIFYYLRHFVTLEYGGCGNVIGYNYGLRLFDDNYPNTDYLTEGIHTHGGHPYMNLFEGNICSHIVFDNALGSSRYNTAFRNHVERYSQGEARQVVYNLNAIEVQRNNLYENVIGNILCRPGDTGVMECTGNEAGVWKFGCNQSNCSGADPRPEETILRHGNFDYVSGTTNWDPQISDHSLPTSLYLTSRPSFFGSLPWPIIGPDLSPMVSEIPAKLRFEGKTVPLSIKKTP